MYTFEEHLLSLSYFKIKCALLPLQLNDGEGALLHPPPPRPLYTKT